MILYMAITSNIACMASLVEHMNERYDSGLGLLVSYAYMREWNRWKDKFRPGIPMMLDSGAFSVWKSGRTIDLAELIAETKNPVWDESVGLDDMTDPAITLENCRKMKAAGSPAYPVFHYGEPFEFLQEYLKGWDKVGISCRMGESPNASWNWLIKCFEIGWPKRFHSFGYIKKEVLLNFPFHTADAASWTRGPAEFGNWRSIPGKSPSGAVRKFSVRKGTNIRSEIEWYEDLAKDVNHRWRKEDKPW